MLSELAEMDCKEGKVDVLYMKEYKENDVSNRRVQIKISLEDGRKS